MIKTDKIRKPQPVLFYIIDYLWSGFAGLSVAMMVVALWAWGSVVFGEFMLPAPADVFQKALDQEDALAHFIVLTHHCRTASRWTRRCPCRGPAGCCR